MVDARGIKKASRKKVIVFLRVFWPIDWCTYSMYTAHFILLGVGFPYYNDY